MLTLRGPKVDRFVALGAALTSSITMAVCPIVVYVPEGMEVRYRAGSKSDETGLMDIVAWNVLTTRTTVKRTGSKHKRQPFNQWKQTPVDRHLVRS